MRLSATLIALLACAVTLDAAGRSHVATAPFSAFREEHSRDAVIQLTAIVTDARGQILPGLNAGDFELLVDGKPQPLDSAEFRKSAPGAPRAFAFLLDEFHTAAADSAHVRDVLLRFVSEGLRPGDLALVVKPLDPLTKIKPTPDREGIRQAIATFEGRKGDYTPRTVFERNYMAQAPAAVQSARAQIVTSAVRAIGMTLAANKDVRPAIVLISDGFARMRTFRDVPASLEAAVRIVNRADAPVYAFAPALNPPATNQRDGAEIDPAYFALRELTTETGGQLFTGTSELDSGLARMNRELDSHYVLTYRAGHGPDGRFHAVQLGVKRSGIEVRARSGYVAPASKETRAAAAAPAGVASRVLRRSALIQSWSGVVPIESGSVRATITWTPSTTSTDTAARARASTVVITAVAPDGTVLFDGGVGPVGERPSPGVPNRAVFDAPAGAIRVDMKILDAKGIVIDTDARDITVPSSRKSAPVIYPPAVLLARSAREFRDALADPTAPPVPGREFWRTDRLLIRVAAVDPAGGNAPVRAVLLNRWRQPMRNIAAVESAPVRGVTHFDLPLAALAPGEYTLQITADGPERPVSEHVTFRVKG